MIHSPTPIHRKAIVATTPDDSHSWNLTGIQLELEDRGYVVTNLGACTPADLLAETIRSMRPQLVVLSSINGHGALSIPEVLEVLEQYQMLRVAPIAVGGLLTTDPATAEQAAADLLASGIDKVFIGDDAWRRFDRFIADQAAAGNAKNTSPQLPPPRRRRAVKKRRHSHRCSRSRQSPDTTASRGDTK